jgi:hypothetical protein
MMEKDLYIHREEEKAFKTMMDTIAFDEEIMFYYKNYTEKMKKPDLLGKTIKITDRQFPKIYKIANKIAKITYNGARCLNIQDRYGLEEGKDANFIVLNGESPFDVIRNRAGVLASIRKGEYLFKQKPVEYDIELNLGVNY